MSKVSAKDRSSISFRLYDENCSKHHSAEKNIDCKTVCVAM